MPLPDDADPEILISRLAGPLAPADRAAFRAAAEAALAQIPAGCWGEGVIYRAITALQHDYFHAPNGHRMSDNTRKRRVSKLIQGPPLEHGRDLRFRHLRLTR